MGAGAIKDTAGLALAFWRRLRGLFRRRRPPAPAKPPAPALADAVAARVRPPPPRPRRLERQVPASEEDIERLGRKTAVSIALAENVKRLERATIRASDGEMYYRFPGGSWVKTSGNAAALPDGTLRPLPPDPRPTKRERAKARRRVKREKRDGNDRPKGTHHGVGEGVGAFATNNESRGRA